MKFEDAIKNLKKKKKQGFEEVASAIKKADSPDRKMKSNAFQEAVDKMG
jgi:hypothetical protein